MGRFVIAVYKPKLGRERELVAAIERHASVLWAEKLITEKQTHVMRASDGAILEVFEWQSEEAAHRAHSNPAVRALWDEFAAACDFVPLASLAEAKEPFSHFDAVSFVAK